MTTMTSSSPTTPQGAGAEHTPTPWAYIDATKEAAMQYGPFCVIRAGDKQIASFSWNDSSPWFPTKAQSQANAAFIVTACNQHAALTARNKELENDKERLDWLIANRAHVTHHEDGMFDTWKPGKSYEEARGKTARESIDLARALLSHPNARDDMSTNKDGGPAFPVVGMSLRDYFAGQALAGLRSRDWEGAGERSDKMNMHHNHADICRMERMSQRLARIAYEDADAMLVAREAKP